jgi:hypothetical protein
MKISTKEIRTKADLASFITNHKDLHFPPTAEIIFNEIVAYFNSIRDKHGRANETRDAVKNTNVLRKKLITALTKPENMAPRKKTDTPKETRKVQKAKKSKYDNTPAVNRRNTCLCGCGAEVTRLFLQGHDARLKGKVKAVTRGDLNKGTIGAYALEYIARWSALTNEEKRAVGASTSKTSWGERFGSPPKSWDVFLEAIV